MKGVKEIGTGAFRGRRYLERVDFPSRIRTIHVKAFVLCWLIWRRLPCRVGR